MGNSIPPKFYAFTQKTCLHYPQIEGIQGTANVLQISPDQELKKKLSIFYMKRYNL